MDAAANEPLSLDTWAIVELFGKTQTAGRVRTQTLGTSIFLRLDVPESHPKYSGPRPAYTRFLNPAAVFAINPATEEVARAFLDDYQADGPPVDVLALPKPAAPAAEPDDRFDLEPEHDGREPLSDEEEDE